MERLAVPIVGSALLAACATAPDDDADPSLTAASVPPAALVAAATEPPARALAGADVVSLEVEQFEDEPVCENKRRAGSRIGITVCYTREEQAALEKQKAESARQYARDLDRERAMKDQQQRQPGQSASVIVFQ